MVASFGERLKKEREKRGMTLEEVSGVTKVSVRNLRALEQEKFDQMPGGIFNRGFVRAYAKHLGLDDDQVVADYMEAAGEAVPSAAPLDVPALPHLPAKSMPTLPAATAPQPGQPPAQVPWAALIGLVVLGTLVLGFWSYHSRRQAETPSVSHLVEVPAASPNAASPNAATPPRADSTTIPASPTASAAASNPAAHGSGFDLALRAHDEVWLSSAVDGQPPSESIMEDGQSITVHASDRAILKVGNAGALDVVFNGQKVPVRALEGEVRTLTFTATGLQAPAAASAKPN